MAPIEAIAKTIKMETLWDQRDWKTIIDQFGAEDFNAWPFTTIGTASFVRGKAWAIIKNGKKAEADLQTALRYTSDSKIRTSILATMGSNRETNLKDDNAALDAYRQNYETRERIGAAEEFRSVQNAARILARQKQFDKALATIQRIDLTKITGYWKHATLITLGDIHAAAGNRDQANSAWRSVLADPTAGKAQKDAVESKLRDTQKKGEEVGWTEPFNGKDLSGWDGADGLWRVADNTIIGETTPQKTLTHHSYLIWKDSAVRDFELKLQFRISGKRANSGVQYRSRELDNHNVAGYQYNIQATRVGATAVLEEMKNGRGGHLAEIAQKVQLFDNDIRKVVGSTGNADTINASFQRDSWNKLTIRAVGNRMQHWLNGHLTVDVTDNDSTAAADRGVIAFQLHSGPPMKIELKQIRLRHL